jgi:hypothetical protein
MAWLEPSRRTRLLRALATKGCNERSVRPLYPLEIRERSKEPHGFRSFFVLRRADLCGGERSNQTLGKGRHALTRIRALVAARLVVDADGAAAVLTGGARISNATVAARAHFASAGAVALTAKTLRALAIQFACCTNAAIAVRVRVGWRRTTVDARVVHARQSGVSHRRVHRRCIGIVSTNHAGGKCCRGTSRNKQGKP